MSSMIANAVLSIQVGIKDYRSDTVGRALSAVRNIYAGVLLLCKEVLDRHSPVGSESALIKAKIVPVKQKDGTVRFVGKGKATVDRRQIEERFKDLNLDLDWKRLNRIGDIRNEVEHYFSDKPETLIKEAIADSFILIHRLVVDHLGEAPLDLLGEETWQALLEASEVFEDERKFCEQSFDKVKFRSGALRRATKHSACTLCTSSLVMQCDADNENQETIELCCNACGTALDTEDVFEEALAEEMWGDNFIAGKDGGYSATETCPECDRETYIVEEGQCALCGFNLEGVVCARCGEGISVDEYSDEYDLCGYCAHMSLKND